jgi:hypothetical protein
MAGVTEVGSSAIFECSAHLFASERDRECLFRCGVAAGAEQLDYPFPAAVWFDSGGGTANSIAGWRSKRRLGRRRFVPWPQCVTAGDFAPLLF